MIERVEYLDFLKKLKDKKIIKVVTGIRRCGKSTLFELYKKYLLDSGVDREQIISFNFENPKDMIFNNWRELYDYIDGKLIDGKMNYIFLDEVQILSEFERVVNGLFIRDNVDIYITGSNSYMLSSELATYLTGRYMQIHMLPLSFREYLDYTPIARPILDKVKVLVLFGNTKKKIYDAVINEKKDEDIEIYVENSLDDVIRVAYDKAKSGQVVLFSPASASFDMFKNFADRGIQFKDKVNKL